LSGSALTDAALSGTAPASWYAPAPNGHNEWASYCRDVMRERGAWLAPLRNAFGPAGAKLVSRVADGRGVVVSSGQQAGLFGGPWYTWFKALAARELAAEIQKQTGIPAVPVFWAATDDADFAEAASTVVSTRTGPQRLSLEHAPPPGVPVSHAMINGEIDALFDVLNDVAGPTANARTMQSVRTAFRSGATLGGAYVELLRSLLEGAGIAVIDASHPDVAAASRAHMAHALSRAHETHALLATRQDEITNAGFDVPVGVDRELSLVFAWEPDDDGLPRKRRLTLAEAPSFNGAERLSPNVLLRPVLEALLMPSVAYLAGPSELAYFSQVTAVADSLDVRAPLALPRWSGMLIPREVDETLERFGIEPNDLRDPANIEGRVARAALPLETAAALASLRATVDSTVHVIGDLLTPAALTGARGQLWHRIDRIERRVLAAVKRREAESVRALAAARGVLFPFGVPQERALNAIPFLARHSTELGLAIRAACTTHARRLVSGALVPA
jgi:bacillithiol biosynthesis cysteine-adding enzyme BshC